MTGYKSKKAAAQAKVEGPIHVVCQCDKCKAQPAQELEAWANSVWEARATHGIGENTVPLYITPPQRPWVGLTDEEVCEDKALKLALEWAEAHGEIVFAGGGMDAVNKMNSWVVAIKEALAQPEQEPADDVRGFLAARLTCWYRLTEKESDELLALFEVKTPQCTWVGLTDEDWKEIEDMPDTFDQGVAWCLNTLQRKNT